MSPVGNKVNVAVIFLIVASLIVALLVAVIPIASRFALIRPELVCLIVIYWVMAAPQRVGVVYAWTIGLFQDVVEGSVWGGHAMALSIVAFVCLVSYQRIRNYAIWQQTLWVFVFVGAHQVIVNWIQGIAGYHSSVHILLIPSVITALCWPIVYLGLQRMRVG